MNNDRHIRITHRPSGEVIAEGPLGWGIMRFEGNYYIRRQYLQTEGFKVNFVPGICFYKFLYVWLGEFHEADIKNRTWRAQKNRRMAGLSVFLVAGTGIALFLQSRSECVSGDIPNALGQATVLILGSYRSQSRIPATPKMIVVDNTVPLDNHNNCQ